MKIKILDQSNWNEQDHHMHHLLSRMNSLGGFLGNTAYLIVFNKEKPSDSYITCDTINKSN